MIRNNVLVGKRAPVPGALPVQSMVARFPGRGEPMDLQAS
jgi:hypothetical protein